MCFFHPLLMPNITSANTNHPSIEPPPAGAGVGVDGGVGVTGAAEIVSVAFALVTAPSELVTTTV